MTTVTARTCEHCDQWKVVAERLLDIVEDAYSGRTTKDQDWWRVMAEIGRAVAAVPAPRPACRFDRDPRHVCLDKFGQPVAATEKVCHDEAKAQLLERIDVLRELRPLPEAGIDRSIPRGDR